MKHARLSASAAHRWLKCPGSARLSKDAQRSTNEYAAQGTVAHSLAAAKIANPKVMFKRGDVAVEDGFSIVIDQEMLDGVQMYADMVKEDTRPGDLTWTEVDLTPYLSLMHEWLGGNADHIRFRPSTGELRVIDFKYGAGVMVSVVANEQLQTYALGAIMYANHMGHAVREAVCTIVQPRIEHEEGRVRDYRFPVGEILAFAATLLEGAKACEDPNAAIVPGDEQCKWCPAKIVCPALNSHQALVMAKNFDVQTYDPKDLALGLDMAGPLEAKIKHMREFAYAEAVAGRFGPEYGYKLVEKRPARKWMNEEGIVAWARANEIEAYEDPELKSPAQIEKALKKAQKEEIKPFYESKSSGMTLVPVADNRAAILPSAVAAEFQTADTLLEFKPQ